MGKSAACIVLADQLCLPDDATSLAVSPSPSSSEKAYLRTTLQSGLCASKHDLVMACMVTGAARRGSCLIFRRNWASRRFRTRPSEHGWTLGINTRTLQRRRPRTLTVRLVPYLSELSADGPSGLKDHVSDVKHTARLPTLPQPSMTLHAEMKVGSE